MSTKRSFSRSHSIGVKSDNSSSLNTSQGPLFLANQNDRLSQINLYSKRILEAESFPKLVDLMTSSIKRLLPNALRMTFIYIDPLMVNYVQIVKELGVSLQRVSFSFDGENLVSVSGDEDEVMHPAFLRLRDIVDKSDIIKKYAKPVLNVCF